VIHRSFPPDLWILKKSSSDESSANLRPHVFWFIEIFSICNDWLTNYFYLWQVGVLLQLFHLKSWSPLTISDVSKYGAFYSMPGRMSLILQFLVPLIPTWSSPANLGSTVIVTPISACVSEVTRGIFFRKLAVLKTTKSDGSRDVDHMFVPISTLERQKDRETEGLKLSEMVARPRLGIRSQRKLGAEWNECRYFDTLTPICLVRCVVRTSPCFRLLFVHTHSSYFEHEHASTEILPTNPVWIYFGPFLSILSWASEPSISDIILCQIVPYNFSKRAKKVFLIFQILHGAQKGRIC